MDKDSQRTQTGVTGTSAPLFTSAFQTDQGTSPFPGLPAGAAARWKLPTQHDMGRDQYKPGHARFLVPSGVPPSTRCEDEGSRESFKNFLDRIQTTAGDLIERRPEKPGPPPTRHLFTFGQPIWAVSQLAVRLQRSPV